MLVVLAAILAGATALGLVWRHRSGRVRVESSGRCEVLSAMDLGAVLGRRATFVQFSTSVCQPCRVASGVLGEIAAGTDGVAHVEIDAEARLDLVRRLNVLRTPTVLVLDEQGRIASRASGAPRRADMLAALASMTSSGKPDGVAVAEAPVRSERPR